MASTITWLHLSDLQFRETKKTKPEDSAQAWERDRVLGSLLDDVKERIEKEGLQPDFIVATGDIAFSGKAAEYEQASGFFVELLGVTGLGKDRLFVIPGNHDVDQDAIKPATKLIEAGLKGREIVAEVLDDKDSRRMMFQRLDSYAGWVNSYFGVCLPFDDRRYFYAQTFNVAGRTVAVLGLNSAWAAHGGDEDKDKLLLGEEQVRLALQAAQGAGLRLALMHHSFDWLRGFDRADCETQLSDVCQFILRGHEQQTQMTQLKSPDGQTMVITTGASYDRRDKHNTYNIARLDTDTGRGVVYLRMYSDLRGGHWAKDVVTYKGVSDGRHPFQVSLPEKQGDILPATGGVETPETTKASEIERMDYTLNCYLTHLVKRYSFLDFRGMGVSDRVPLRLPLAEMYVPLKARVELPEGETWSRDLWLAGRRVSEEEAEAMGQRLSEPVPLLDLLQKYDGLIVLGDPGAGKTTFLKYLTLRLALQKGDDLGLDGRLPVLVPLSAYANAIVEHDVPLNRFVARYYEDLGANLPVGVMLDELLKQGRVLLLLDGLDEVKNQAQRHTVVNRVVDFFTFAQQRGNKFVMTSRIVGYREVRPVAEGLAECTLVDFEEEDIALFLEKWTIALEKAARDDTVIAVEEAERERAELSEAVARNSGVRRLASNPLLLTILALMKRQGVTLPERRVELYEQYVTTLLKLWNLARGLGRSSPARDLDVVETLRILAPLALWMHETSPGVGLVKRESMKEQLKAICAQRDGAEAEKAAWQLLNDVRDHAGLLLERGAGMYGFIHLTFQEYLAAVALASKGQQAIEPVAEALAARVGDDNWHEVMLLTIGYMGIIQQRDEAAGAVLGKLMELAPGKPGEVVVWAGEAALDAWPGGVSPDCRESVRQALQATLCDDNRVKPAERAAAGRTLAKLGDERPGVGATVLGEDRSSLPDMAFCLVPAGPFWMGGDGEYDGKPAHLNKSLDYDYWMGRYPVTNAQFECFVKAGGYGEKSYWAEAQAAEVWRKGMVKGRYDKDWRVGSRRFSEPFGLSNHPVVGLTWYEALAFSRWLEEALRYVVETRYIASLRVRLPSEAEWEKAARGGLTIPAKPVIIRPSVGAQFIAPILRDTAPAMSDNPDPKRAYPWGDEADPNRMNYDRTGIGTTSAAGCFPGGASPYGCEDMSGNVWEWMRSLYKDYPYRPGDGREELIAGKDVSRVLRGGAFHFDGDLARCAQRLRSGPYDHDGDFGFRLLLAAAL